MIGSSNLSQLQNMPAIICHFYADNGKKIKWLDDLQKAYAAKVLLLATGVRDIVGMLDKIPMLNLEMVAIHNRIIEAYAARTKNVYNLIYLLDYRGRTDASEKLGYVAFITYQNIDKLLVRRIRELTAINKHPMTLSEIRLFADIMEDGGRKKYARTAEDTIISLAIPAVKNNLSAAVEIAGSFKYASIRHRFLLAYLDAYGLENQDQANLLANTILSSESYGNIVAKKIMAIAQDNGVNLGEVLWTKLEDLRVKGSINSLFNSELLKRLLGDHFPALVSEISCTRPYPDA